MAALPAAIGAVAEHYRTDRAGDEAGTSDRGSENVAAFEAVHQMNDV
jgi:hypothetical protein